MDKSRKTINWGEAVVPGVGLLFGIAYFLQVTDASWVALYWPVLIAAISGILWLMIVLTFVVSKGEQVQRDRFSLSWLREKGRKVSLIFLASIGYLLVIPYLGFSLTNFCFMILVFRCLGSRKWAQNLVVALVITVFLHVALIVFMKMSLPQLTIGKYDI
jgi:hypothetical protein